MYEILKHFQVIRAQRKWKKIAASIRWFNNQIACASDWLAGSPEEISEHTSLYVRVSVFACLRVYSVRWQSVSEVWLSVENVRCSMFVFIDMYAKLYLYMLKCVIVVSSVYMWLKFICFWYTLIILQFSKCAANVLAKQIWKSWGEKAVWRPKKCKGCTLDLAASGFSLSDKLLKIC